MSESSKKSNFLSALRGDYARDYTRITGGSSKDLTKDISDLIRKAERDHLIIEANPDFKITSIGVDVGIGRDYPAVIYVDALTGATKISGPGEPLSMKDLLKAAEEVGYPRPLSHPEVMGVDLAKAMVDSSYTMKVYYFEGYFYKRRPEELYTDPNFMELKCVLAEEGVDAPTTFSSKDICLSRRISLKDYGGVWRIIEIRSL